MKRKACTAIVLAAGQGKRMGGDVHKQFLELLGHPVVYYSIRTFQESPLIDQILLVTGETEIDYVQSEIVEKYHFDKVCAVAAGGHERYASVWTASKRLKKACVKKKRMALYSFTTACVLL